jgi:hypothetical protein
MLSFMDRKCELEIKYLEMVISILQEQELLTQFIISSTFLQPEIKNDARLRLAATERAITEASEAMNVLRAQL